MLALCHIELADANEFVAQLHRHHKPTRGHRFSLAAYADAWRLCGVAIVGRPVAKSYDWRKVVEVTRLCTDGTHNACSFLYGASARAAAALGYERIQTYTLASESGASLRAVGWVDEGVRDTGAWTGVLRNGKQRANEHPLEPKRLWSRRLV